MHLFKFVTTNIFILKNANETRTEKKQRVLMTYIGCNVRNNEVMT